MILMFFVTRTTNFNGLHRFNSLPPLSSTCNVQVAPLPPNMKGGEAPIGKRDLFHPGIYYPDKLFVYVYQVNFVFLLSDWGGKK